MRGGTGLDIWRKLPYTVVMKNLSTRLDEVRESARAARFLASEADDLLEAVYAVYDGLGEAYEALALLTRALELPRDSHGDLVDPRIRALTKQAARALSAVGEAIPEFSKR